MLRILLGVIVTAALLLIAWIAFLFIWGTMHSARTDSSMLVLFCAVIVGASCIWGIFQIWRGQRRRLQAIDQQPSTENGNDFDEDAFDLWLARNGIQTAGMSKRELVQVRQRFLNELPAAA